MFYLLQKIIVELNKKIIITKGFIMNKILLGKSLFTAVLCITFSNAYAADKKSSAFQPFGSKSPSKTSSYVGASICSSTASNHCTNQSNCEDSDTSWKVYGGYRLSDLLTLQGGYTNLGERSSGNITSETKGFTASALASYPVNEQINIFGKAGIFKWNTETSQGNEMDDIDPLFGLGADYKLNENMSIRGEWDNYKSVATSSTGESSDVQMLSVGMTFSSL